MRPYDKFKIHIPVGCFLRKLPAGQTKQYVLLLCDDALGDLLMMTGVICYLKKQGYRVGLVLRDTWQELGPLLGADQVFPVNQILYRKDISYRIDFLNQIRQTRYTWTATSLFPSSVSANILKYCGSKQRCACLIKVTWNAYRRVFWANQKIKLPCYKQSKHLYVNLLQSLAYYYGHILKQSITPQQIAPTLSVPHPLPMPEPLQGIGPYVHYIADTHGQIRQYPVEKLLPALLEYAKKHQIKLVVTAKKATPLTANEHLINLTGKTSLAQLAKIIFHARAVIGNETGPAHMAWILHKPTVMIYGGGHFGLFRPAKTCLVLYKRLPCFGCAWDKCPYPQQPAPCISGISLEKILSALEQAAR